MIERGTIEQEREGKKTRKGREVRGEKRRKERGSNSTISVVASLSLVSPCFSPLDKLSFPWSENLTSPLSSPLCCVYSLCPINDIFHIQTFDSWSKMPRKEGLKLNCSRRKEVVSGRGVSKTERGRELWGQIDNDLY